MPRYKTSKYVQTWRSQSQTRSQDCCANRTLQGMIFNSFCPDPIIIKNNNKKNLKQLVLSSVICSLSWYIHFLKSLMHLSWFTPPLADHRNVRLKRQVELSVIREGMSVRQVRLYYLRNGHRQLPCATPKHESKLIILVPEVGNTSDIPNPTWLLPL